MTDSILNILTLGIRPLYKRQGRFHRLISDFRNKLSRLEEGVLTKDDIETFYSDLNTFDFRFILFADYYQRYIENLNRFKPRVEDENPDITFLLIAIAEDKWKPTEPVPVFVYHLRYKFKPTSRFFISHQKKQNRKKLDAPGAMDKRDGKPKSSKEWTRVPLPRDQPKSSN